MNWLKAGHHRLHAMLQVWGAATDLQPTVFAAIDRLVASNLRKVQQAFREQRIGPHHFQGSTGYGHGDWGREALDNVSGPHTQQQCLHHPEHICWSNTSRARACRLQVMARVMGAEAALVRIQFMSGTHAISAALHAVLRPGDEMLAVVGQ